MKLLLSNITDGITAPLWSFDSEADAERILKLFRSTFQDELHTVYHPVEDILQLYLTQVQIDTFYEIHCRKDLGIDFIQLKFHIEKLIS